MSLNSYNLSKQSVVYGMFNQFVFNEAKTNIDLIERYFLTDPTTIGNNLIKELLDAIRKYDLGSIDEPLFRSILAGQGKTDTESNDILREIVRYKMCDTHQIDPIRQYMRGVGNQSLVDIAMSKYSNDPEGYIKYLRTHEYKADYADVFTTINFKDIDINTIQATSMGGWKSSFDFINDSFQPMRKYENGQIVMWVGAPGCFTGDTKVRLTDGTEISMKDLSEGIKDGKEFSTYCKTESGDTVETKIKDCWITKETDDLIDVYIDNGSKVRCTPDHKFLMRDRSYKEAKDLKEGDSLMSDWTKCEYSLKELYEHKDDYLDFLHINGYLIYKITNKVNGKCYIGDTDIDLMWRLFDHPYGAHLSIRYPDSYSHLYCAMRKYGLENFSIRIVYTGIEDEIHCEETYITYYDSFNNGYNGSPTGKWGGPRRAKGCIRIVDPTRTIEKRVKPSAFKKLYEPKGWTRGVKISSVEKLRNTLSKNPKTKGRRVINNSVTEKYVLPADLEYWLSKEDEDWVLGPLKSSSEKRIKKMKKDGTGFFNKSISSAAGKKGAKWHEIHGTNLYDPEVRKRGQINGLKSQKENNTGIYSEEVRRLANENSQKTLKDKKVSAYYDPILQPKIRELATKKASENRISTCLSILDNIISEGLSISETVFENERRKLKSFGSTTLKWKTLVSRLTLDQKIKYGLDNHKVLKIEKVHLDEKVSVYDLEVEHESHNFMLADGEVFVHNCGKTLSMINECLKMTLDGARTHYLALGDMNQKDFVQRMGAIYTGMSFGDTMKSISSVYNQLCNALGDRFSLTILPAATVTVDEYIEYMMSRINDFDVLFIDYDSNFKPTINDNMYKEGGYVYDNLTKLTKLGKLVHVASQPKIGSWRSEVLEITDAGESSRKQHNVDCMITLSRGGLDRNPNHIGYFKIAKNRRGEEGIVVPYIRLNNGRFRIIPQDVYNTIACIPDKRNYTDADINRMIDMSNNQMMQLQQQMTMQQGQANQSTGKSKSKGGKGQQSQQTFDPDSIISNAINQFKPLS